MKSTTLLLVALGATATVVWLWAGRRKRMNELPVSVGDLEVQRRYIAAHEAFLREFPELKRSLETVLAESQRKIAEARSSATDGPQTDEEIAKPVVFSLQRAAYDDFAELLILAGNGLGLGATKVLRSIYERLVTAMYIAKKPSEAKVFIDNGAIEKGKIINRYKDIAPDRLSQDFARDELDEIQKRFAEGKARQKVDYCNKCGHSLNNDAWTRKNLDEMAREVEPQLYKAYVTCYLQPTMLIHATPTGLDFRVRFTDDGPEYKLYSEKEAHGATTRGHFLILGVLNHLNSYFEIGRDDDVRSRFEAFNTLWSKDL